MQFVVTDDGVKWRKTKAGKFQRQPSGSTRWYYVNANDLPWDVKRSFNVKVTQQERSHRIRTTKRQFKLRG